MKQMTLLQRVKEVEDIIPFPELVERSIKNNRTLFGEVVTWMEDYYKVDSSKVWGTAVYLVGKYAVSHYLQDELANKTNIK